MRNILAAVLLASVPAAVHAACVPASGTVLTCTAKGGAKVLEVCIEGRQVVYNYGPNRGAPELVLTSPVAQVEHQPWNGIGRSIWETTTFRNGGYAYEVYMSVDRMVEGQPSSSGVTVYRGGAEVARVACDPGSDTLGLFAVSDAKQALGICWDPGAFRWGSCG